ncbi:MAG: YjbQ family protein [Planctomycetes bacterium]|nr:YjbQ family protein [Planctomycetota bacterium]
MENISVETTEHTQFLDITSRVQDAVRSSGVSEGICMVYVPHTTAGITINENADPSVRRDIETVLGALVPWNAGYTHSEGNSAAHVKASLMGFSVQVPVAGGRLALGTWQGIYFCEFDGPRNRRCVIAAMPLPAHA